MFLIVFQLNETHRGQSAIHVASYKGELGIIQTFLSAGAGNVQNLIEMKDDKGCTPLITAVKG